MHHAARDDDASSELGPADFQQIRIIHAALMVGATMFLLVVLALGFTSGGNAAAGAGGGAAGTAPPAGAPATPTGPATTGTALEMPALLACIALGVMAACLVARVVVTRAAVAGAAPGGDDVGAYASLAIIRAALLEGPALFGLVALLLAGLETGLADAPLLTWAGLVPYVVMIGLMLVDRPGPAAMRRILGGGSGDAAWKAGR